MRQALTILETQPMSETFQEFANRQGCRYFNRGDFLLFENGAVSNGDKHADPPSDEKTRLQRQRDFYKAVLAYEVNAFKTFKAETLQAAALHAKFPHVYGSVGPENTEQLRLGQLRIKKLNEQLEKIDGQLADPVRARNQDDRERALAHDRSRQHQCVTDVLKIEI